MASDRITGAAGPARRAATFLVRLEGGIRQPLALGARMVAAFVAALGGDAAMLAGILAMLRSWQARRSADIPAAEGGE